MTTPQEPAPESEKDSDEDNGTEHGTTTGGTVSAEDVDSDGPLDADEGDPQVDAYPG
jgi:hypothetical protein